MRSPTGSDDWLGSCDRCLRAVHLSVTHRTALKQSDPDPFYLNPKKIRGCFIVRGVWREGIGNGEVCKVIKKGVLLEFSPVYDFVSSIQY